MLVVIDTNKLPRNAAKGSAAFERLCQLSQNNHVSVSLPEPVVQEWTTQTQDQIHSQADKAQSSIKKLLTGGNLVDSPQFEPLGGVLGELETTKTNSEALAIQSRDRLVDRLGAEVRPIAADHGKRVSDAYYAGAPPFSSKKNRNDFPDAFIYESVVDLANEHPDHEIVVVTADKNLAKHLGAIANVEVCESLDDLIESPNLQQIVAAIESENEWRAQFDSVVERVETAEEDLRGQPFTDTFIENLAGSMVRHPSIPSDNSDAYVSMINDPEDIEFNWDEVEDYGPGRIRVPFNCTSEVLLDFFVYYADAYGLPEYIGVRFEDPEEKSAFDAEAHATVTVSGYALVSLETPATDQTIADAEITVDEIEGIDLIEDDIGNALH